MIDDRDAAAQRIHAMACDVAAGTDGATWHSRDDAAWAINMGQAMIFL